jgi:hypothetical protein
MVKTYNPVKRHRPRPLADAPLLNLIGLPSTGYTLYVEPVDVLLRLRVPGDEGNLLLCGFVSHAK